MGALFHDAIKRLDTAATHAKIDSEALERLRYPKSILQVSIPVRMDNGSLRVFDGYRVRHDDTRGNVRSVRRRCGVGAVLGGAAAGDRERGGDGDKSCLHGGNLLGA